MLVPAAVSSVIEQNPERAVPSKAVTDRTVVGVLALLASTVLFPMSDMVAKTLTTSLSGLEVAWMRYVVLVMVVVPIIVRSRAAITASRVGLQVVRGVASAVATALAIVSFSFLPVADATAIGFVTPLIVTGLAVVVLKEKVGWRRWLAAFVGFCGILIIVQPGSGAFQTATILPLVASVFSASTVIVTRLGKAERVDTTIACSALIGLILLSGAVLFAWRTPSGHEIELGLLMGLLGAAATVMQVIAYRCAPSSMLAPFSYTQLIWAGGLGWLVFGTVPGPAMLTGSAIIVGSGLFVACRERAVGAAKQRRSWTQLREEFARLRPVGRAAA